MHHTYMYDKVKYNSYKYVVCIPTIGCVRPVGLYDVKLFLVSNSYNA